MISFRTANAKSARLHGEDGGAASTAIIDDDRFSDSGVAFEEAETIKERLLGEHPSICSKYFYDRKGSELFDRICELPEYYPTRTEDRIMAEHVGEMVAAMGSPSRLIEYGSGSSQKTRRLLASLPAATAYVPVDISEDHLHASAAQLREDFPTRLICPVAADFTKPFEIPEPTLDAATDALDGKSPARDPLSPGKDVIYFPGSTIGNFARTDAAELLRQMASRVGTGGGLLIGFDLVKDPSVLEAAYDDSAGVTAAFNRNILDHVNRLVDADFCEDDFDHVAFFNDTESRIEMHLQSRVDQVVQLGDDSLRLDAGQRIRTEYSHKYTLSSFELLAESCGWELRREWLDDRGYFAVAYFEIPSDRASLSFEANS